MNIFVIELPSPLLPALTEIFSDFQSKQKFALARSDNKLRTGKEISRETVFGAEKMEWHDKNSLGALTVYYYFNEACEFVHKSWEAMKGI